MVLAVGPDVLHWVQFRRVGWQILHLQSAFLIADKLLRDPTAVGRKAVPNQQNVAIDVARTAARKGTELFMTEEVAFEPAFDIARSAVRLGAEAVLIMPGATDNSALAPRPEIVAVGGKARVDIEILNAGRKRTPHLLLWEPVGDRGGAPMQLAALAPWSAAVGGLQIRLTGPAARPT